MDVQGLSERAAENTELTPRDHNVSTLARAVPPTRGVFVASALLDWIELNAAPARRLLVTSWVLSGGGLEQHDKAACTRAVHFWHQRRRELLSWRAATVTTVLFDLERLGLVESFEAVAGGFSVNLREAIAA